MSRIRNIKPAFFKDTDLFDGERDSGLPLRVAYAGLWTVADRAGRFKWNARSLKSDVLPYDQVDMDKVLSALVQAKKVFKYSCAGEDYGFIKNFLKHQFINKNEVASQLPEPPTNNNLPLSDGSPQLIHCETTRLLDTDGLTQTQTVVVAASPLPPKPVRKVKSSIPENFPTAEDMRGACAYWAERDRADLVGTVQDEVNSFRAHHSSHGNRMADWGQAWITWYSRAIKFNRKPDGKRQSPHERVYDVTRDICAEILAGGQGSEGSGANETAVALLPARSN